nr:MAG TPA: hypothetical protein [Caudoviricetes sp.]
MNYSNLFVVFVTSWFWLCICAIVSLFSYVNGLDHADDHFNWSTGFSQGWDAGVKATFEKGWEAGAKRILKFAEEHGLEDTRKAFEVLQSKKENPPE